MGKPLSINEFITLNSLNDLVGQHVNIRNLDQYKINYIDYITKVRGIVPNCKIAIAENILASLKLRRIWGYDIIHKELINEYNNMVYVDAKTALYDYLYSNISGNRKEVIISTGADTYELSFTGNNYTWQGFKVLVDGINIYGKNAHIEHGRGYYATADSYNNSIPNGIANNNKMKLIFTGTPPAFGKEIEVQFADNQWSSDYTHPNTIGNYIFAQAYMKIFKINF